MGESLGRYYVLHTLTNDSKLQVAEILTSLRDTFKESLPNITWLDESTRAKATKKIDHLVQTVGHPTAPDTLKPSSIQKFYEGLEFNQTNFLANILQSKKWHYIKKLAKLGESQDISNWEPTLPHIVNAFHRAWFNEIVVPSGILQPPFYSPKLPEYLNYGSIGVVAGHEVTHGFDSNGRFYDANGILNNWWTNASTQNFNIRAQCFVNQNSKVSVKGPDGAALKVNGFSSLGETIADNGGMRLAFATWKKRFDSDRQMHKYNNRLIPGLENFTREQLFFISFAQSWCSIETPASLAHIVNAGRYLPNRWRVNGLFQNSAYFAEAFNCRSGSPMNPIDKCTLCSI
ncbi:uncharacterized protein VTP21DRAFT_3372 [Calcarisporiella thermophila]|uniref:uncharacterized protein n=1 Tax=Calcarisporiella thermophila TaxID=911321 RepID=UPI003742A66F